jgi:hypothetical protein
VSEAFLVRDSSAISVSRYIIILMDADSLDLLDYTRAGGIDVSGAHALISSLAKCVLSKEEDLIKELGSPLEMDVVFEEGHVKIIFDREAGLLRALVDKMAPP